jgi:hypothetical protein
MSSAGRITPDSNGMSQQKSRIQSGFFAFRHRAQSPIFVWRRLLR